jgi:ribonuclease HII
MDGLMSLGVRLEKPLGFRAFEAEGYARGFKAIAGVDEVGRGPLAGPVVAAAVILPRDYSHPEIKDSKLLSPRQRGTLAPVIRQDAESWGLGVVDVGEIDRINILQASLLAMAKALDQLRPKPDYLLIDGNQVIAPKLFRNTQFALNSTPHQETIVKGDRLCLSIAAASIVAKVARDEMMVAFDKQFPQYGFAGHKGYGSAAHLEALRRHGPSPIHRMSYKPVRDAMLRR